jgi:putative ABC transport system permease protein
MFIVDNVKLATRNFRTRKLRTFLTVLGISVGIGAILFLVSLGYGLQKLLIEKIAKSDTLLTLDVAAGESSLVKIDRAVIEDISKIPGVMEVSRMQNAMSICKLNDISSQVTLNAVNTNFFRLGGIEPEQGKIFQQDDAREIILSQGAIDSMGIGSDTSSLGKEIEINLIASSFLKEPESTQSNENDIIPLDQKFSIVGIIDDQANSFGFIPINWTEKTGLENYNGLKVKIIEQQKIDEIRNLLIEKGLLVMALSDTVDQANKIFSVIQIVLALFGIVALTVSAIGMFNTMTISLLERTNEIGIMKSIGASNRDIRFLFLTESILIGSFGGIGGVIIGFMGTTTINLGFNFLANRLGGQSVNVFYTPIWFILFVLLFSTLIGLFTGIYPAERASKLNPLVALRYK